MAGAITIDTLKDGAGNTGSATDAIKGSARAWVNFNGTGTVSTNQAIRASYNVSSVFKNGMGDYTINFATAMPDTNYAAPASGVPVSYPVTGITCLGIGNKTTTSVSVSTTQQSSGRTDFAGVDVAIFR